MIEPRPDDVFQPGDLVNNTYRVEAILGRGGTSVVFRARNEISGRQVAIKVLKSEFSGNEDYLVLLKREEAIREVRHDAVVRYGENHRTEDGHVYLLMDYVEGPGLDKKLKEGPMPARDLLVICRRVAEGLEAAHQRNIVHRDLSPDNIILRDGDPAQAVIIDFGIAKDTNPGAETIVGNEFAGKYAYAAPEQLSGHTDARTDIYSLGALLLANFRGKSPDVGANPLEVVQKKNDPLDTTGVPEPLKTLIDRMTDPDPAKRLQSATAVLDQIARGASGGNGEEAEVEQGAALSDATVIAAPPAAGSDAGPAMVAEDNASGRARTTDVPPSQERRSRAGLMAVLMVLVLVGAGAGGYFAGLFDAVLGPSYPVAQPFSLVVEQKNDSAPRAVGYVPSEGVQADLERMMADRDGRADLTLASGDIAESWGQDVLATLALVAPLDEWRLAVSGNKAQVSGLSTDRKTAEAVQAGFANGLPGALSGDAQIRFKPLFLAASSLQPILDRMADCGPLTLSDVPPAGYGADMAITVQGRVAATATRVALFDALSAASDGRKVILDVEVLNRTLCLVEQHLPQAPESDIDIAFTVGDRNEPNPSGRFFVGENPVIDVVLPADVTEGYLTVSVLDVSGNVFHLLPNIGRSQNSVRALREGREAGEARVRVAYSIDEAETDGRLAFRVDDSTLGKSKVIVLHSTEPLFGGPRPTEESALGYAEALKERIEADGDKILSLDSRILETARP